MKRTCKLLIGIPVFILLCSACDRHIPAKNSQQPGIVDSVSVVKYNYDVKSIPDFFREVSKNHLAEFQVIDSAEFHLICENNELLNNDSANVMNYFTINIIHDLLTSQSAWNGSTGEILNIPYLWHWVTPNPRHEIRLVENNKLLKEIKPPKEFGKYQTYADIDRTPFLYMSELFSEQPKYYSEDSDTFSTFGWCSEREMAFVCLMSSLGYEGKVVAQGNHSWSELLVTMKTKNGDEKFVVSVDNTFNGVEWKKVNGAEVLKWKTSNGNSPMAKWYNDKAHSPMEKSQMESFVPSVAAMGRIEQSVVEYIREETGYLE